jgi:hypothetical protein
MNFVSVTSDLNISSSAGALTNCGLGWFAARTASSSEWKVIQNEREVVGKVITKSTA